MTDTLTIAGIAEQILRSHNLKHGLTLKLGECLVRVKTNSVKLADKLGEYYTGLISRSPEEPAITINAIEGGEPDFEIEFISKQPDTGKIKIKEEYADLDDGRIIRKIITGMTFVTGAGFNIAIGQCAVNYNQIVNFINNRYIEIMLKRGNILFHASGIEHLGNGMAIAGFSGAGKSTMALHMMRRGLKFVSNDRIMAGGSGRGVVMHGVPKLPRVNPGTVLTNPRLLSVIPEDEREEFLKLPADELWDLEHKYDVHIDEIFGSERVVLNAPMRSLIILNWKRDDETKVKSKKVDLYRRRDLLKAFMKDTGLFFLEGRYETKYNGSEEAYLKLLENVNVYEISGGVDFDEATEILMDILDGQIKK